MRCSRFLVFLLTLFAAAQAPASASDAEELTRLLNNFLAGASRNDLAAHERFWAEELVYTSSSGQRFGKQSILDSIRDSDAAAAAEAVELVYSGDDIRIQQYGDAAVVAFRLVATRADASATTYFYNTGTFLKRNGEWRVVAWQATRIPEAAESPAAE